MAYLGEQQLSGRPFILLPGGLHFRKNAELVLEAWPLLHKRYPGLLLAVVNHSDEAYVDRARALGESVRLLGFVSDDGLRALYGAARLVWFPSRYEGFGLPVIEAMACGTPVVASRASSLPEIAGTAALLVPPDLPGVHAEALGDLFADERSAAELSARGRARASLYTWTRSAAHLRSVFEELV